MPIKKKTTKSTTKTRVSKQAKKQGFKFRWWMGVVIILIVAIVGLVILRFSRAAGRPGYIQGHYCEFTNVISCENMPYGQTFIYNGQTFVCNGPLRDTWNAFKNNRATAVRDCYVQP